MTVPDDNDTRQKSHAGVVLAAASALVQWGRRQEGRRPIVTCRCQRFAAVLANANAMTQGHRGSVLLRCRALSYPPPCRFIPAHLQFPGPPSDHSTPHTSGGSWAPAPRPTVPSMAFARCIQTRLLLVRLAVAAGALTTLQASLHVADWPFAPPLFAPRPLSTHRDIATGDLGVFPVGVCHRLRQVM